MTDGQQLDRPALGRGADGLEPRQVRELRRQRARPGAPLLEGEEVAPVGHPGEERRQVDGDRYDSSFEE
jgi:hypothetical protein